MTGNRTFTLLKHVEALEDFKEREEPPGVFRRNYLSQQEVGEKVYHDFKILEIQDNKTITIHNTFVFKVFNAGTDKGWLLLSDDYQRMLELLDDNRIYLHEWTRVPNTYKRDDKSFTTTGSWKLIRQLVEYDRSESKQIPYPIKMTPSFKKMISQESQTRVCVLSSENGVILNTIDFDAFYDESQFFRRFKWLDNDRFTFGDDSEKYIV